MLDAEIVRDFDRVAVLVERHIEVDADEDALAVEI